jgi:Tol biopolymer transport system component
MNYKILAFVLFILNWQKITVAENKTQFDAYKAEADGYFINFMETTSGIVATDNYASSIYLFNNGKYTVLFSSPGCGRYMKLSPDKKSIGFKYIQTDGKQAPALLNIQTKAVTLLHSPVDLCGQVSFAQNGKTAFTIGNELIVKSENGSVNYSLNQYTNIAPISPDGKFACFNDDFDQLFLLNLLNKQVVKLTTTLKGNIYPQWSPDGSKLMYSSISGELYIYDMMNQSTKFISEGQYPSWINDSQHIIFTKTETSDLHFIGSDIYKSTFDGSQLINITNTPENFEIAAIASGNKIIYQSLNQYTNR